MALPPPEFERKARRTAAWTVVAALLFYAVALRMAVFAYGPVLGFVVCTPVLAGYASWLLLHNGSAGHSVMKWLALRVALALPLLVLVVMLDVPTLLYGMIWYQEVSVLDPERFSPLVYWPDFMNAGGRFALTVAAVAVAIGLAGRWVPADR